MSDEQVAPPRPHRPLLRRRRRSRLGTVVDVGALLLVVAVVIAAWLLPSWARANADAALVEEVRQPGITDISSMYVQLNAALAAQDRTAFFAHVDEGRATQGLSLWWDNMDRLGWTTGAISPASFDSLHAVGQVAKIQVVLGTDLPFPQGPPPGHDGVASDERYTFGFVYAATVDLNGPHPLITDWAPLYGVRPWDEALLSVVRADGVVVAGLPEEQAYLDQVAAAAVTASAWSRADYELQRGRTAVDGFVVFATQDHDRFRSWLGDLEWEVWVADPAGFAFAGYLPPSSGPGIGDELATGDRPSGGVVAIGPDAAAGLGGYEALLVHEFAHVLQLVDHPTRSLSTPLATPEGWATFQEVRYRNGGAFPVDGGEADLVRACLGDGVPVMPRDKQLLGADAGCAYLVAATLYAYAEAQGVDAMELAGIGTRVGVSPFGAAQRLDAPLSGDGWAAWVTQTYG